MNADELMALHYELAGIAADVDATGRFDSVCRATLQRVMDALAAPDATAAAARMKISNQRRELRRLNKYIGPYRQGFRRGMACEAEVKLRRIMNATFGHAAVRKAEQDALAASDAEE